jgi:hypothetical protein
MTLEIHRLVDLSTGQHGAIAPHQAALMGVSTRQLRRRVQSGILDKSGTHVVRSPFVDATPLADLAAFVLDCGPGAVASGISAAALHEFDGFELAPPFHVTIPRGRAIDRAGHHVHTSARLDPIDCTRVHGIPTMTPARDIIDLARVLTPRRLTVVYDSALRDRRITEDLVHARIADLRSSGRYGIPKLIDVIEGGELIRGGHTWLERRFLEVCGAAGLPPPTAQVVLTQTRERLVRVDFEFPGTNVIVEVLGYSYHRGSRSQLSRDAERINALVMAGKRPIQFTYEHVTLEPDWVAEQVREALATTA